MENNRILEGTVVEEVKPLSVREKYVKHLREVADFFEQHEDVPTPTLNMRFDLFNLPVEDVPKIARAFGQLKKEYIADDFFVLKKKFGDLLTIEANWRRDRVCTRVVVGQKQVTEQVAVAFETVNKTVDVVEWRCTDSILAPKVVTPALPESSDEVPF